MGIINTFNYFITNDIQLKRVKEIEVLTLDEIG
jgi:hypothetical protein